MPYNKNIIGYMTEIELISLSQLAKKVPENGTIVEVGSCFGRSSVCFALSAPTSTVYCVDNFHEHDWVSEQPIPIEHALRHHMPIRGDTYNTKRMFMENTRYIPNIIMVQGKSPEDITYAGKEIDLFFLDAEHANPGDWNNICYWLPLVKEGGIISGHDRNGEEFPDVVKNVEALSKILNVPVTIHNGSVWSFPVDRKITKEELLSYEL